MSYAPRRSIISVLLPFVLLLSATIIHADPFGTSASMDLYPPPNATFDTSDEDDQQRGIFITAIKDFDVCGIVMSMTVASPGTLSVAVYAADGTQATALIAEATYYETDTGATSHTIPITCSLKACRDYNIRVGWQDAATWPYALEAGATLPYDIAGAFRVREGEVNGDAVAGDRIVPITVLGEATGPSTYMDITSYATNNCAAINNEQRGVYITPTKTVSICAVGLDVFGPSAPYTVFANIYDAVGTTRGASIAFGAAEITTLDWQVHMIPINAVLLEGHDYDISISVLPGGGYRCISESEVPLPYFVDATIMVRDGENLGIASNTVLPHVVIEFNEGIGPGFVDLSPAPTQTTTTAQNHGLFVTALTDIDVYTVGWRGSVPGGTTITARIYEATGTTRGVLLAEGSVPGRIYGGNFWHDIPVPARLAVGQDYDIEVVMTTVDQWDYAEPIVFFPYNTAGLLKVNGPETDGNSGGTNKIAQFRIGACEAISSSVSGPVAVPGAPIYLSEPAPNPVTALSTITYQLESPEPVEIALYDVAGRKVAVVLNTSAGTSSGVATIDATGLASGVYFVKLTTPSASVARKVLVVK